MELLIIDAMKVEYKDTKFSYLDRALIDGKTHILGSNETLCELIDLCAYGWKFFPRVTYEPLNYLPLEQKPLELTEAEIVRKTLLPTIRDGEIDKSIHYFGSISSGSQTLYMISVPRGSKKVKFYEGDSLKIEVDMEEPKDEVLLWFVVSKDVVSDINLSYYSWLRSTLPHRNYFQHVVGLDYPVEVVEEEGGYWFDKTSGTILANTKSSTTPILDAYRKKLKGDTSWSPRVHYKTGDVVDERWIAIEDNVNSYPPYSSSWISKKVMDSFRRDISIVSCPFGEVVPSIIPTPQKPVIDLESLKLEYGYVLEGHLSESYQSYVNKTYTLTNVKDVPCEKWSGALVVPIKKSEPIVEVYINGEPKWPKNTASDIGITKELHVPLGSSFMTDPFLTTKQKIGEITGIKKTYLDEEEEVLGEDTKVDSLVLGEATTPILSDTVTLPCEKVKYDITLTYYDIQLVVEEYSGFYINTAQQTSLTSETKYFYLKPIDPSLEICSVDVFLRNETEKHVTLVSRPSNPKSENSISTGFIVSVDKKDDIFVLGIEKPTMNLRFKIYGS